MSLHGLIPVEPQSFLRRYLRWLDVLDPIAFLVSDAEIQKAKVLLESLGKVAEEASQNRKVNDAVKTCQASLHPDTGNLIPTIFRPPAFMPIAMPLVIASSVPHRGPMSAFLWQGLFQSYCTGFNLLNRNQTFNEDKVSPYHSVFLVGTVLYTACCGAVPLLIMNRYKLTTPVFETFFRKVLPGPLLAALSAFNVVTVRIHEINDGIEVTEKSGKVIGVSRHAGRKAVTETAVSRAALVGISVVTPILLEAVLKGYHLVLPNRILSTIKHVAIVLVFGTLVPASFAFFPQNGKIARMDLEKELQVDTAESELFYHRGL